MKNWAPEIKNKLAGEYVLGTLTGKARIRFQQLLMTDAALRKMVWDWETHLNSLGISLPQMTPDEKVWQAITSSLGFDSVETNNKDNESRDVKQNFWGLPTPAWMAMAAAVVFAFVLLLPRPDEQQVPPQIAIVQNTKAQSLWLLTLTESALIARATDKIEMLNNNDYELWMVAADGRAPISLGVLPKTGLKSMERIQLFDQVEVAALAVSLEPLGGSPTGSPSKVLFTTELVETGDPQRDG